MVEELDWEILAGVPFMRTNKIIDISNDQITIGKQRIPYISEVHNHPQLEMRRARSFFTSSR